MSSPRQKAVRHQREGYLMSGLYCVLSTPIIVSEQNNCYLLDWDVLLYHKWNFLNDRNNLVNWFWYWIWYMLHNGDDNWLRDLDWHRYWVWFWYWYVFRHMHNVRLGNLLEGSVTREKRKRHNAFFATKD